MLITKTFFSRLSQFGAIRMEKKRSVPFDDRTDVKKVNGHVHSEAPIKEITPEVLEDYKKEALCRQLLSYRRQRDLLEERNEKLENDLDTLRSCFGALETWWDRLMDSKASKLVEAGGIPPLLGSVSSDKESFDKLLGDKAERIEKLISSGSDTSVDSQLSEFSNELHELRISNEKLRQQSERYKKDLADMTNQYLATKRAADRRDSPVTRRIDAANLGDSNGVESPQEDKSNNTANGSTAGAVDSEALKELEKQKDKLEEDLAAAENVSNKRQSQIDALSANLIALSEQCKTLTLRLENLSEGDLSNCATFKALQSKCDSLSNQVSTLTSQNESILKSRDVLNLEKIEMNTKLSRSYDKQISDLEAKLTAAEANVARLRTARDDALGELEIIKKQESTNCNALKEVKSLIETNEQQISLLKSRLEAFESEAAAEDVEQTADSVKSLSVEELQERVIKLTRQNKSLRAQIPSLEEAFQSAYTKAKGRADEFVNTENKMKRLQLEKSKADEKYFQAMRAKDALNVELTKVKSQLMKSTESIQQLKDAESAHVAKVADALKQKAASEESKRRVEGELRIIKVSLQERDFRLEQSKTSLERLSEELKVKSQEIAIEAKNRRNMELEMEKLKTQVENKRMTTLSSNPSEVESQMEALRAIAMCSVCTKNWKDTALKCCGHVFCNECAQERLDSRQRKCPQCNKQYSQSDLLPVHL